MTIPLTLHPLARAARRALPAVRPLAMPRQDRKGERTDASLTRPRVSTIVARSFVVVGTAALFGFGVHEMWAVLSSGGVTAAQWLFFVLFGINFLWIAYAAVQSIAGFVRRLGRRSKTAADPAAELNISTAILLPVYNEDPARIRAALEVMSEGLARRAPGRFAFFVLSDTTRPQAWIREEAALMPVVERSDAGCPVFYRRRRDNVERKAGNIGDWVHRFGGAYDAMLVLDADSLMEPDTMVEMAYRLQRAPDVGLIQTLPVIVRSASLFGRLQQFANRCYGPIFGAGLASWHGVSGNYWGHNAIIRTEAFAGAAHLPLLSGRAPWGGHVMSHDFVEAAMLRRAGWGVRIDDDLGGSYEEAPPSFVDVLVRDRRWCQGNLQHVRFLLGWGLPGLSRLHLLTGIMSYLSAVVWFAMMAVGLAIAVQAAVIRPEYFAEPGLVPTWPTFDSERAVTLFVVSLTLVLLPKALGWLSALFDARSRTGFGGPIRLTISVLGEVFISALYAPVAMAAHCGIVMDILLARDAGWGPQRRDAQSMRLGEALRLHRSALGLGLLLTVVAWLANPWLVPWLLPVTLGLSFAGVLSWLSAKSAAGRSWRKVGLLRTPEETDRPPVVRAFEARLAESPSEPDESNALEQLASVPGLIDWHLAQLDPPSGDEAFDPALILALAKADRCGGDRSKLEHWLSTDELRALLTSHEVEAVIRSSRLGAPSAAVPLRRASSVA